MTENERQDALLVLKAEIAIARLELELARCKLEKLIDKNDRLVGEATCERE